MPSRNHSRLPGRGTAENPANRFEPIHVELDPLDEWDEPRRVTTRFYRDFSKTVITSNNSPDVGFTHSLNPYRGCEHGCVYCYARPTHEYLGFSSGLDFESRIMVKEDAPALLLKELSSPRWEPVTLAMSGVTDPYQPVERRLGITRGCLEVLADLRHPVGLITKNFGVTRDIDVLRRLADVGAVRVTLSVTSLDSSLAREMEPRTASPARRLEAIRLLAQAGIPVGVNVAPIIPGLNDHEIHGILEAAAAAGASHAGFTIVRLPYTVAELFDAWIQKRYPTKAEKVLARIRSIRGGKLNDGRFGARMRGEGIWAEQIRQVFTKAARRNGLGNPIPPLSKEHFRRPGGTQLVLW